MITLFHGVNCDGIGYWIALVVEVSGEVHSRIVSVRETHRNKSVQLQETVLSSLASCGMDEKKIEESSMKIDSLLSEVRAAHPGIFGRFA